MVDSTYFKTQYLQLTQDYSYDLTDRDSFTILICVAGSAELLVNNVPVTLGLGHSALIPAAAKRMDLKSSGCTLLEVSI
jgi:mannose-6-phosphate isomerase